jgi:hypothetical protein
LAAISLNNRSIRSSSRRDAVKGAGLPVSGVKYEKDGSFMVVVGEPAPAGEKKPNSFDRMLGGAA